MVEEKTEKIYEKNAKNLQNLKVRPKAVYYWSTTEVFRWFNRHCGEYEDKYAQLFIQVREIQALIRSAGSFSFQRRILLTLHLQHDITGRALLRLSDNSLKRMGIHDDNDRDAILKEILKQRLKRDIMEQCELQKQ